MIWPYFERRRDGFVSIVLLVLFLLLVCAGSYTAFWATCSAVRNHALNKSDPVSEKMEVLREEKNDIPEYPTGKPVSYAKLPDGFSYITVDGHQYLTFTGQYRFGMTHSPKCPCHNNKEEK